jgi:hypothetical protein
MNRLPSVPTLRADDSVTSLIRRTAPLYGLREDAMAVGLGLPKSVPAGHGVYDILGFPQHDLDRVSTATGYRVRALQSLSLREQLPALADLLQHLRLKDVRGHAWAASGVYRTHSPACPQCLREDPNRYPLAWRLCVLPICIRHGAYLLGRCTSCGMLPGKPIYNPSIYYRYCANGCSYEEGPPPEPTAVDAQERVLRHATSTNLKHPVLGPFLDFAWFLSRPTAAGERRHRSPSPAAMGSILVKALQWADADPAEVAHDPDFRTLVPATLKENRPFRSANLTAAFQYNKVTAVLSYRTPKPLGTVQGSAHPHYLPIDLHRRYTADLIFDGWPRSDAPTLLDSRRVAAEAVAPTATGYERQRMNPARMVRAIARNLEQRGQLETWEDALRKVRRDMRVSPRSFGATTSDLTTFTRRLEQLGHTYPPDAAVVWFLRDHRCADYIGMLAWPRSRFATVRVVERHARHHNSYGPWPLVEERLRTAAMAADAAVSRRAQTA